METKQTASKPNTNLPTKPDDVAALASRCNLQQKAIREALDWLYLNAPGRAVKALESAITFLETHT